MVTFDFKKYQYNKIDNFDLTSIYNQFLKDDNMKGWFNLNKKCMEDIKATSQYIRENTDIFLVIGIGGSYMGAKAVISALNPSFKKIKPEIIFAGYDLSSDYLFELIEYVKDKEVMVNIISKSGTTLEPSITFDIIVDLMKNKYSENYNERIFATTDSHTGLLHNEANEKGYKQFIVPNDIGGRFSVLTPVGLLPIAVAGYDIDKLFDGANKAKENMHDIYYYTALRHELYKSGKVVESFDIYDAKLTYFVEWLKQLFGESQGKKGKGILPVSTINTRDLHSLGQYYQDGKDMIFSTSIFVHSNKEMYVKKYNKKMDEKNEMAMNSVLKAHYDGQLPSSVIMLDKISLENLGYLILFFEMSAALGSYLLNVKYYDQPGVNGYKEILNNQLN
jgi:glucose-6-phosphate isomerase